MLQINVVEKVKAHIFCSTPFSPANRTVNEIKWKNIVEPNRPHVNKIRHMGIACWMPRDKNTPSEYVIPLFHENNGYTNAP